MTCVAAMAMTSQTVDLHFSNNAFSVDVSSCVSRNVKSKAPNVLGRLFNGSNRSIANAANECQRMRRTLHKVSCILIIMFFNFANLLAMTGNCGL